MADRFDELAAQWDSDPGRLKVTSAIADAMISSLRLDAGMTLLDYGCGTGLVSLRFAGRVGEVIAADRSEGMLQVLRGKISAAGITGIRAEKWSADDPGPAPFSADAIVCAMALHHIKDVPRTIGAFMDILTTGGQVAIADLDSDDGQFHTDPTGVEHNGFNRKQIADMFEAAGFRDVNIQTALEFQKPAADGDIRTFSIFLLTAIK